MTSLPLLLRDSALAAAVFAVVGQACGHGFSVAAGAVGGTLNLVGLVLVAAGSPSGIMGRLAGQQMAALFVLYVLLTRCEPGSAMIGLLAPLAGITVRTLISMRTAQTPPTPTSTSGAER